MPYVDFTDCQDAKILIAIYSISVILTLHELYSVHMPSTDSCSSGYGPYAREDFQLYVNYMRASVIDTMHVHMSLSSLIWQRRFRCR